MSKTFIEIIKSDIQKFNPYHDRLGRFTTAGGAASFTYAPGKSKAHDNAIAREKERAAASGGNKSVDDCKTVQEVEELFKQSNNFNEQTINGKLYRSVDGVSLTGCDLESAKEIYKAYDEVFAKYPQLKGKLNAVNTAKLSSEIYAECHFGFGHGGIAVNTLHFKNSERLAKSYENDVAHGFSPKGTTWKSIMTHEIGHAIDDYLTNTMHLNGKNKTVSSAIRSKVLRASKVKDVSREVSGYATKDAKEFFAECFAEGMHSKTPRKVATEFMKQLDQLMKEVN